MEMGWDTISFERGNGTRTGQHASRGAPVPGNGQASGGWADDHERLKPSFFAIFAEHPLITLFLVLLFGVLVFGRVLP
jgi:hypothetical protein